MANYKFSVGDRVVVVGSYPVTSLDSSVENLMGETGVISGITHGSAYPYRVSWDHAANGESNFFRAKELTLLEENPQLVSERIIARIYRLYAKCQTTRHWFREDIAA